MGVEDVKGWVDILTSAGFLGVAWYLLKFALPEKDRMHAEERRAWEASNAKMWEAFRAEINNRADKYEHLMVEVHECMARLSGGTKQ